MFHIPISGLKYLCAKSTYFCSHRGEKTRRTPLIRGRQGLNTSGRRGNPPNPIRGGGGRCYRTCRLVATTGDHDVVKEECHFTSESAQIIIREIMGCNRDVETLKENINDVQNKMKNIIDVLGRI
ncbi:hypothetical protein AB205_0204800 [Aquarana catesbeiana]|uniref:Uncharacterized protein n=1 Tax=Aquarana catesbeiana TaxID=8400 RepID=A0A2G9QI15_AQUCT|nr:hypothetical protein AB205_0204800 [Aquarana catesbeiana]